MVVGGIALKRIGDVKHLFEDGDHPGLFPAFIIAIGALVFVIAFFGELDIVVLMMKLQRCKSFQDAAVLFASLNVS
jgi:uncharacterized RDD family membrane protein YckC